MKNKQLSKIILTVTALLLLLPFAYTFILSFKSYTPLRGLAGSPWVGFANYAKAVMTPHFLRIFKNSAIIGIFSLLAGTAYVFISVSAVSSIKNKYLKSLATLIFCIPTVIPANLLVMTVPQELLVTPSFWLQLAVAITDGLRLSGLVIIAALFVKDSVKCALLFAAIRLMSIFTSDSTVLTSIYNPLTYEVLDTLTSYTYRTGLLNGDASIASATHILKTLLQLLPAAFGVVVTAAIFKHNQNGLINKKSYYSLVVALVPLAVLTMTVMKYASYNGVTFPDVFVNGYTNGVIIAIISALATAALSCFISQLVCNSGVYGLVISALLITSANSIIGNYLIIRSINLANTPFGVILQNLSLAPVTIMVLAYVLKQGKSIIPVVIAGAGICFAWFWGDTMAPMIILNNRELFPVSLMFREALLSASVKVSALWYIVVPLAVNAISLFFASKLSKE